MTTMAALFGTLPIAIGIGPGSDLRQPLGVAVVGGFDRVAGPYLVHNAGHLPLHVHGSLQRFCGPAPPAQTRGVCVDLVPIRWQNAA